MTVKCWLAFPTTLLCLHFTSLIVYFVVLLYKSVSLGQLGPEIGMCEILSSGSIYLDYVGGNPISHLCKPQINTVFNAPASLLQAI